jgi:hypothetical protein
MFWVCKKGICTTFETWAWSFKGMVKQSVT